MIAWLFAYYYHGGSRTKSGRLQINNERPLSAHNEPPRIKVGGNLRSGMDALI
jgi:hypothetical protein